MVWARTRPFHKATGQSDIGTHFILETEKAQAQNVGLGPAGHGGLGGKKFQGICHFALSISSRFL
jgi:hypothetical protein